LTEKWCQLLVDEISSHLSAEQRVLLWPYMQEIQQLFLKERSRLGYKQELAGDVV
jgi:recombinational DNA repair ATPase RecF